MGWSCSAAASKTMEALAAYAVAKGFDGTNHIARGHFFEASSTEFEDGSIEGRVHRISGKKVDASSDFARIDGGGKITAMPGLDLADFMTWIRTSPRWAPVVRAHGEPAGHPPAPRRVAGFPIATPVRVEEMGAQGLALVGGDFELIFSSFDITKKEMSAIAGALNNREALLIALRDMVRYITSGDHHETKNPYARPVVAQALMAIREATGFKGNWMEADKALDSERRIAANPAPARAPRPR